MSQKKRKLEDGMRGKTQKARKRIRKQKAYHSSSEEEEENSEAEFAPVNLNDSEDEAPTQQTFAKKEKTLRKDVQATEDKVESASSQDDSEATENEDLDGDDSDSQATGLTKARKTTKRNDPEAFSTSMSKILSTKLSQSARKDPVLSRSRDAMATSSNIANERLEQRAKAKMRAEKKEESERGRIKDVLGLSTGEAGKIAEEEKRLRKIAQRGVVKLFNAVRAAQVRGEQAAKEERKKGTVGMANREEKVNEMSKQGFLELISGKSKSAAEVAET